MTGLSSCRLTRYSLERVESVSAPLSGPVSLPGDLVPFDWLPPQVHMLRVDAEGRAKVEHVQDRRRPARVPLLNGRTLSFRSEPVLQHGDCVSFGEPVTATFVRHQAHDAALEAQLAEDFDARSVYADALTDAGDPFGEALAVAGDDGAPSAWVMNETRLPLVEVHASWRRGFAHEVEVDVLDPAMFPAGLLRVLHARPCAYLQSLSVRLDVVRSLLEEPLDVRLATHLPKTLRSLKLVLGQREAVARSLAETFVAAVRAQCPQFTGATLEVVTHDPSRAEPGVERMLMNLRGK